MTTPHPGHFISGKPTVPIVEEAEWNPRPGLCPHRDSIPNP